MSEGRNDSRDRSKRNPLGVAEFSEDSIGVGQVEIRTLRDTLLTPRTVLEAYMTLGPTAGGVYTRPLKLYLALCGALMLLLFFRGGAGGIMSQLPSEFYAPLIEQSGKSSEAFLADVDSWMSLTLVPILSAFYALAAMPVLRLWDRENLGWRRGLRASFVFLNVWTITLLPIAWFSYDPQLVWITWPLTVLLGVVAFVRAGRGRWWRTPAGGVVKGVALAFLMQLAAQIGMIPVMAIGLFGGLAGP
ncbi:hypothetical protein E4M02_01940 [Brevundimonas sp. S30B]|uniref:hypothetical protein n=1 Tax=unclassified Brevundimonas TaxID=2622653 RepID=UPI001071A29A|nr:MULTISPECIES: hypothetical protein [unclassified Brevundimonas]QBX37340.1 hypothetical protein E4M01_05880 [Brevundimonas sp. MF30-B]TFW03867.1 hypothetical protein E4M02_01940 [Brevundimonas sp. S30B]